MDAFCGKVAVVTILRGVARGRPRVLVGIDARAADLAQRLTGVGYQRVAATAARWFVPSGKT